MKLKMTGAQALVKGLEDEDVDVIFGYPGGVVLPIYDALYDAKSVQHILVRHEQAAAHAADSYARVTGKVGVCLATSGPGATNLVTGIANAYMDSIPMVAITGQVATSVMGTDAFQEANTILITMPIVKHSYLVTDASELPQIMKEAFHIARSGRPGPVVIDMPADMSAAEFEYKKPEKVELPGYKPTRRGNARQIREALKLIDRSERPVLFGGGGVIGADAAADMTELAIAVQTPVTMSLMGKGGFPEDHELSLGMPGMHGARYANYALQECDLIIALGVRFDDRVTGKLASFAPKAKIIHVDVDPAEIGKNVTVDVPIVGNSKQIIRAMVSEWKKKDRDTGKRKPWLDQIAEWKQKYPLHYKQGELIRTEAVISNISDLLAKEDGIITTGVGQHQMWAAQWYKARNPRSYVTSGGLGTMGFGLPAAIGAAVGRPDSKVVLIDGDGSFQMVSQELATVSQLLIPITMVIINNGFLGMVRQWQGLFYERRYSSSCLGRVDRPGEYPNCAHCTTKRVECSQPDFVKLAEAYGIKGVSVTDPKKVKRALKDAIHADYAVLLDIRVSPEDDVFPMVAPGSSIGEMLGGVPGGDLDDMIDSDVAKGDKRDGDN